MKPEKIEKVLRQVTRPIWCFGIAGVASVMALWLITTGQYSALTVPVLGVIIFVLVGWVELQVHRSIRKQEEPPDR